MTNNVILKRGREKLPKNRHPWIFSGAVQSIDDDARPGDIVTVREHDGTFLAYGHIGLPQSALLVRLLSWDEIVYPDAAWLEKRIAEALAKRVPLLTADTNACRLIFSEGDLLPGLVVDRFADTLVLQSNTLGMDALKHEVARILLEHLPECRRVVEKSDADGRKLEKLPVSMGHLLGETGETHVEISENGLRYKVHLDAQKTGFYTDQRFNRLAIRPWVKQGGTVADICSYTGGFAANALMAGAGSALLVDTSASALESAANNLTLNGLQSYETRKGNAFDVLRRLRDEGRSFDMIVLDPPKLIRSERQAVNGYKDLNFNAMRLLNTGGVLVTFSCSGNMTAEMLRLALAYAAKDAGKTVRIVSQLHQSADHPVLVTAPETEYLKGFICIVDNR